MAENAVHYAAAGAQADLVRTGQVSATELLDVALDRYERHNPQINAVVVTQLEEARRRAAEADEATAAGRSWGPLHGVPMTIKESFDWIGTASTSAHPHLVDHRPDANSVAVQRLLDAGAIVYGKTNLPVGMSDWQTFNSIYGTTNNPWDLDRVPGGSSGGAAAALATGMSALELGSDIGGSIRNPAHYCGVFGHKPTFGVVPAEGHGNPGTLTEVDINVAGPLARSAADLELALHILAGPSWLDTAGWQLDLPTPTELDPSDLRVGVMLQSPCVAQDDELTDQLTTTIEALEGLGVRTDWDARPDIDFERAHEVYLLLLRAATGAQGPKTKFDKLEEDDRRFEEGERDYRAMVGHGVRLSHWEWCQLHEERQQLRQRWAEFFHAYDLLLCPIAASAAFPHDQDVPRPERTIDVNGRPENGLDQIFWAGMSCGVYLPGTVAPAGLTESGLPCGLQIVAPHLHDRRSIAFAAMMERELGGFRPAPGFE